MIIQTSPQGTPRFAITMDEHTALAGHFARVFGNSDFEPVEPRDIMLDLVTHHDKGWADLDARAMHDPRTGLPYNLADTPTPDIVPTSSASPDFNERRHPYGGLLSSMHSWGLYNGRYGMSDMVLIDRVPPAERHIAERMLEAELARQARLKDQLSADAQCAAWVEPAHLLQNYKQLQFFDTLALYFNRTHEEGRGAASFTRVPRSRDTDVTVQVRPLQAGVYAMKPYPFPGTECEFSFSGRYIRPRPGAADPGWTNLLAAAPLAWQQFRLVAD
jgi:hypothetical protein